MCHTIFWNHDDDTHKAVVSCQYTTNLITFGTRSLVIFDYWQCLKATNFVQSWRRHPTSGPYPLSPIELLRGLAS